MRYEVLWSDIIRGNVVVEAESEDQAMDKAIEQVDAMELKDMDVTYGGDFQIDDVAPLAADEGNSTEVPLKKGETLATEHSHSLRTYCGLPKRGLWLEDEPTCGTCMRAVEQEP